MFSDLIQHAKILIVDDELPNVRLLEKILKRKGYLNVSMTTDSRDVAHLFTEESPDLVLLDLHMPHQDGYEVMKLLAEMVRPEDFLPIIVLTADSTLEAKRRALDAGAIDLICKPFDNVEVALRIRNALRTRFLHLELKNQNQILDERTEILRTTVSELYRVQQQPL